MVIFAAIAMLMTVFGGALLLALTNGAKNDPSDAETYAFLAIIGIGTPLVWSIMNLTLLATRRQTAGQYVAGLRLQKEDGTQLSRPNALTWWFCFNPLLFSWPTALVSCLPLAAVIALVLSKLTIVAFGVILVVCLAAPLLALFSAILDSQNRALHDRIVGTVVVPAV